GLRTAPTSAYGSSLKGRPEGGCKRRRWDDKKGRRAEQGERETVKGQQMNDQAIRFRIGIFVLAALILLAVLVTLFGGFPNFFTHYDTYTIVFKDAHGVGPGTPVRRSGVRIGDVRSLSLDNETGKVEVTIQVDPKFNLRKGDRPTPVQGLLGGDTSIAFLP